MSTIPVIGARMSVSPIFYDIEHGVQRGDAITLPNASVVTTTKRAPSSAECYAIQHPDAVAVALPADLTSLGYTSTAYDILAFGGGDDPAFMGAGDYSSGSKSWLYLAEDGVLCVIRLNSFDKKLYCSACPTMLRQYGEWATSLSEYEIARATSVSTNMAISMYSPSWIMDVKNNGGEVLLASTIAEQRFSIGDVSSIFHVILSGPSTAVVMSEASSMLLKGMEYYGTGTYWLSTGESGSNVLHPASTEYRYAVLGSNKTYWRHRRSAARFAADGSVEILSLNTTQSYTATGNYDDVESFAGSTHYAFVGTGSTTGSILCELVSSLYGTIDSFTLTIVKSESRYWNAEEIMVVDTTATATHSELGTILNATKHFGYYWETAVKQSTGYTGCDLMGDAAGYAYIFMDDDYTEISTSTYLSVERLSNKVYAMGFNTVVDEPIQPEPYQRYVGGIHGINGASYTIKGGLIAHNQPAPTSAQYNGGLFTPCVTQLYATQHPVNFALHYGGTTDEHSSPCCYV